ncbi:hypothetical protein LAJ19_15005 (plasmid) [Deinococcus taeanensis]|uniref:hypothetical protein n=1 Tax=Deinococcus taeanensis TaxID=2737050 RepID=UPI001CDD5090|nr:hypothetical protein [Deinococcus taeanensis]UBV44114.1 hypothetical protein LAJ19_15005 [Deinococcus taeanensis]
MLATPLEVKPGALPVPPGEASIQLPEVARHLSERSRYEPGGLVCIERRGRPWRLAWIHSADSTTVTTVNGYVYDRSSGRRLIPAEATSDRACPLTKDRLDYLMVLEAQKRVEKLKPAHLPEDHVRKFAPIARAYLQLMDT